MSRHWSERQWRMITHSTRNRDVADLMDEADHDVLA
jgi:hypothetical protein